MKTLIYIEVCENEDAVAVIEGRADWHITPGCRQTWTSPAEAAEAEMQDFVGTLVVHDDVGPGRVIRQLNADQLYLMLSESQISCMEEEAFEEEAESIGAAEDHYWDQKMEEARGN